MSVVMNRLSKPPQHRRGYVAKDFGESCKMSLIFIDMIL